MIMIVIMSMRELPMMRMRERSLMKDPSRPVREVWVEGQGGSQQLLNGSILSSVTKTTMKHLTTRARTIEPSTASVLSTQVCPSQTRNKTELIILQPFFLCQHDTDERNI